jgi:phosphate transport system protein
MEGEMSAGQASWDAERVTLGRSFLRDMEHVWAELLKMAGVVESSLQTAVRALCDVRSDLADAVRGGEPAINTMDVQIEEDCLKVLALHQPVASDLRRVAAILRIDRDLERMADLAEHISKRVRKQNRSGEPMPVPPEMEHLAAESMARVRESLDALVKADTDLARKVILSDRGIDRLRRHVVRGLKDGIRSEPEKLDTWFRLIDTTRNLERIADHATNIAESVIYLKDGVFVRHAGRRAIRAQG